MTIIVVKIIIIIAIVIMRTMTAIKNKYFKMNNVEQEHQHTYIRFHTRTLSHVFTYIFRYTYKKTHTHIRMYKHI